MDLQELPRLDLNQLADLLANDDSRLNGLSAGDLRFVFSLLNSHIASDEPVEVARNIDLLRRAHSSLLQSGAQSGAIQQREAALRRVAFLVALAVRLDSSDERDELAQHAERTALENVCFPLEVARAKTSKWELLPLDEIRDLRYLKNLFRPIKALSRVEKDTEQSRAISRWLALLPLLP